MLTAARTAAARTRAVARLRLRRAASTNAHAHAHAHGGAKATTGTVSAHEAAEEHHAESAKRLWRNVSLYLALPTCAVLGGLTLRALAKHSEDSGKGHHGEHAEVVHIGSYTNVRTKPYPWGSGNHTLFWNSHVNKIAGDDTPAGAPSSITTWIGSQIESEESRRQRTREHVTELKARCEVSIADQKAQGKVMPPTVDTRKWIRANPDQLSLGSQLEAQA